MTKHYCDRCWKECDKLSAISIPEAKMNNGFSTKRIEVCGSCEKDYNKILDTLTDIRFNMFNLFFELKGADQ